MAVHLYSYSPTSTVYGRPQPNPTIEPYTYDLNGVDQPRNELASKILWGTLGFAAFIVLIVRFYLSVRSYIRRLNTMNSSSFQQAYWGKNHTSWWWRIKKYGLYAPLFKKRHNREVQLSKALPVHLGTVPSRLHATLIVLYILSNIFYCAFLSYDKPNSFMVVAEFRGRTGHIAVANIIALVLLAGRNNPLIRLLSVSFDTYNLLHRWMGRMVVFEIVMHTIAWFVAEVYSASWAGVKARLANDTFLQSGLVGSCGMMIIFIMSPSPFRHAFYETFLSIHILFVSIVLAAAWVHTSVAGLPQLPYVQVAVAFWAGDRCTRLARIIYCNFSRTTWTTATIEPLTGELSRVTLHLPHQINVKPGSHAYLRFAGLRSWESHPFSIAWIRHVHIATMATLPTTEKSGSQYQRQPMRTNLTFLINAKSGFTRRLLNAAIRHRKSNHLSVSSNSGTSSSATLVNSPAISNLPNGANTATCPFDHSFCLPLSLKAAFEGPYGGHHSLDTYGHALMFAGSSGITHGISYLDDLASGKKLGMISTRRFALIWIVRDEEAIEWIRDWIVEIKDRLNRRGYSDELFVDVYVYVTRRLSLPKADSLFDDFEDDEVETRIRHDSGVKVTTHVDEQKKRPVMQMHLRKGRPNIFALVGREMDCQVGAMCVSVCGPGGLGDDVREAVRGVQERGSVDLVEESFTW